MVENFSPSVTAKVRYADENRHPGSFADQFQKIVRIPALAGMTE
jgi:hypothetical protein